MSGLADVTGGRVAPPPWLQPGPEGQDWTTGRNTGHQQTAGFPEPRASLGLQEVSNKLQTKLHKLKKPSRKVVQMNLFAGQE